jgi:hypothetical protein
VKNKYADPTKVAIMGCFNGGDSCYLLQHLQLLRIPRASGLLVAACVNRAAEGTFGCAVAEGGLYDILKVGLFDSPFVDLLNDKLAADQKS